MRNSLMAVLCLLVCFAGTTLAQRAPKKAPGPEVLERDVKRTVELLTQALAANNADGVRRVCADEVVMTESGRRLRGLQAVVDYLPFNSKNFPSVEIQLGSIEARVSGTMAWAQADSREVLATSHSLKLNYAGYSSYVLERRREGWKIVLIDFNLQPVEPATGGSPTPASPSIEGTWMLESSKNVSAGQGRPPVAMMIFTKTHFGFLSVAPDRRPPKDKRFSDYSRKELQEILREVDLSAGVYRVNGNKMILTPGLTLLPNRAGEDVTLENVKVTPDRLSYETATLEGRFQRVWRRVE